MGLKADCKAVYLLTGHGKKHIDDLENNNVKPNFTAENFMEAADFIMDNKK